MTGFRAALLAAGLSASLAACQSEPVGGPLSIEVAAASPVSILQIINDAGQRCWMRSNDKRFRDYRLVPELDTVAGTPRILLVDRKATTGRPKLVIESDGSPVQVNTYGPLVRTKLGNRINSDIIRWSTGNTRCTDRG